jgi:RNA 2',3'-cyclic 3'-phosphodiesterase
MQYWTDPSAFQAKHDMTHRLFVAFRPPEEVLTTLLGIMGGVAGARWQDEAQLHVTLRYVGNVDRRTADDVASALENLSINLIALRLAGVGSFDGRQDARPIWAGLAPHTDLTALHHKIDHALVRTGLESEHRSYLPHITLARFGRDKGDVAPWIAAHASLTSEIFMLDHIALYESHLGAEGAHYEEVLRVWAQRL